MPITMPGDTWTEWSNDNPDADDADKLAALREIIGYTARKYVSSDDCTAEWANKKLTKLGITDLIAARNTYTLEAPMSGVMKMQVTAVDRAEALATFQARAAASSAFSIVSAATAGDPEFTAGPEDPTGAAHPDAPTTVGATLDMLREIIMLGNIAGPRFDCVSGVNYVLASFGLALLPLRREFAVHRPVEGVMVTVVEAYDQASAERVAGWRWENARSGYELSEASATGDPTVTAKS